MALTVSELAFVFGADSREVDRTLAGMDDKARKSAAGMDRAMGGFWREETARAKKTANNYDQVGRTAGTRFKTGFMAPLAAIGGGAALFGFFKNSIEAAGDLAESGSKLGVVYGDAADDIEKFATDTTRNILLTEQQALDAASTFGIYGKSAGLAGEDLSKFGLKMTSLASDMSSFFNTDTETAIEAIGSALRGEAEPIRQFGVLLDDATLRNRALKMGLIETTKQALTPQQKVLSAYKEILAQTGDAQGDAERTASGYANSVRILQQRTAELQVEVGKKLIPAVTWFVNFLIDDGVPALQATGGAVMDLVDGFNDLPGPVKAAAGALVALRLSEMVGLTGKLRTGVGALGAGMTDLRLRTMLAGDEFRSARTTTMMFNGNMGTVNRSVGRTTASLRAMKVAGQGAGAGLKAGLSGALGVLGGPWGVAMIGATAAVTYFWQEHKKAEQHVDDLTATLDKQTGAITDNTRAEVANALEKDGTLRRARELGLSLEDVTAAAMGNTAAYGRVDGALRSLKLEMAANYEATGRGSNADTERARTIKEVERSIGGQNDAVAEATRKARDLADATGEGNEVNRKAEKGFKSVADQIREAKDQLRALADEENKRREAATANKRDQLAFVQTLKEAHQEAKKGKATLDETTEAGQANWEALLNVADGWNETKESARNTRAAYKDMRQDFIDLAKEMGANDKKAQHLADTYLSVPESMKTEVTTPGMEKALADIERLRARVAASQDLAIYVNTHVTGGGNRNLNDPGVAVGGPVWAGRPYKVNEVGPEIFIPKEDGHILTARQSRQLVTAGQSAAGGMTPQAASSGRDIDYNRLGEGVANALRNSGALAPLMKDVTIKLTDMRDVDRHARTRSRIRNGGGH